ncbi:MAG: cysteine synthase family protein [Candidatus Zixiibacteriota bacterium]
MPNDSHASNTGTRGRYDNVLAAVGDTPLIRINKLAEGLKTTIYVKPEYMNPGGSIKDRMAIHVLNKAMGEGKIGPNTAIVEATSGNTGLAMAMFGAVHNLRVILTIPDKMSFEKIDAVKAYGAEVHVCKTDVPPGSPDSYINVAKRLGEETGDYFLLNQYNTMDNPEAHYVQTGPEIWRQTDGNIDVLVGGVGTGGTMSGTSKFLKEMNPKIVTVAADPVGSILKQYKEHGTKDGPAPYLVEGIGEDEVYDAVLFEYLDEFVKVTDKDSFLTARSLTAKEGIWVGGSAGTAMWAALDWARRNDRDQTMVVILPDSGVKYLSKIYNDDWMKKQGFIE